MRAALRAALRAWTAKPATRRVVVAFEELEQLPGDGALHAPPHLPGALVPLAPIPPTSVVGARVSGSSRTHTRATACNARLRGRSPPRFSRYRITCPDAAGVGLTPARAAKAASKRTPRACDQLTSTRAALSGPIPGNSSSQAAAARTSLAISTSSSAASAASSLNPLGGAAQRPDGHTVLQRPGRSVSQHSPARDLPLGRQATKFAA
jgi:hypothetical protein